MTFLRYAWLFSDIARRKNALFNVLVQQLLNYYYFIVLKYLKPHTETCLVPNLNHSLNGICYVISCFIREPVWGDTSIRMVPFGDHIYV